MLSCCIQLEYFFFPPAKIWVFLMFLWLVSQKSQGGWINSKVVRKTTQNVKAGACSQDQK